MTCTDVDERLEEWHLNLLPAAEKDEVETHIAGCDACRRSGGLPAVIEQELRAGARRSVLLTEGEIRFGLKRAESRTSRTGAGGWIFSLGAALLLFGLTVFWFILRQDVSGPGIELGYRLHVDQDRERILTELERSVRGRLEGLHFTRLEMRTQGDLWILRLPGATADSSARVRRIIERRGLLAFYPAAPLEMQQRFKKDGVIPEECQVVENPMRPRGGEYEAYDLKILVMKGPVIESRHISNAEPHQEIIPGGSRWVTSFELDAEGAKRFDEEAEKLYNQRPPGLIVIMLDGKVKSAPAVQSPSFRGRGQISGAKDQEEAADLALILKRGALPLDLPPPEFERPYGPK